jgi:hypothetical protein
MAVCEFHKAMEEIGIQDPNLPTTCPQVGEYGLYCWWHDPPKWLLVCGEHEEIIVKMGGCRMPKKVTSLRLSYS